MTYIPLDSNNIYYTLQAVCFTYRLSREEVVEMVSWGIANPIGLDPQRWLFPQKDYDRIGNAIRFNQEMGINIPGAALAIELLDDLEKIRKISKQ